MKRLIGNVAVPVSAVAVMLPLAPTFTVATANTPVPLVPGIFTIPSFVGVAASATMSGVGVAEAENSKVLIPTSVPTGVVLVPANVNSVSVGSTGAMAVRMISKSRLSPGGISTAVLSALEKAFVTRSMAWKAKLTGITVFNPIPTAVAVELPTLMTVP